MSKMAEKAAQVRQAEIKVLTEKELDEAAGHISNCFDGYYLTNKYGDGIDKVLEQVVASHRALARRHDKVDDELTLAMAELYAAGVPEEYMLGDKLLPLSVPERIKLLTRCHAAAMRVVEIADAIAERLDVDNLTTQTAYREYKRRRAAYDAACQEASHEK